jgi:hypothetical protein
VTTAYGFPLYGNGTTDWVNHWSTQMFDRHYVSLKSRQSEREIIKPFSLKELEHYVSLNNENSLFQENTGQHAIEKAGINSPVGTIRNLGSRDGFWTAPSLDQRPILRISADGKKFLEFDGINDVLVFKGRTLYISDGYHFWAHVEELAPSNGALFAIASSNGKTDRGVFVDFGGTDNLIRFTHEFPEGNDGLRLQIAGLLTLKKSLVETYIKRDATMGLLIKDQSSAQGVAPRLSYSGQTQLILGAGSNATSSYVGFGRMALYSFAFSHNGDISLDTSEMVRNLLLLE